MKKFSARVKISGFTLIELLIVLGIIAILAFVGLPALERRPGRSPAIACMSNQRQVCLGLTMWQDDNGGKYPWQLSITNDGTMELITNGHVSSQLQPLSNYIKYTGSYVCPTDVHREAPSSYENFADKNTSYFVNVDTATNKALAILIGDHHLKVNDKVISPGLFVYYTNMDMNWTHELHNIKMFKTYGGLGFTDGHCEIVTGKNLNATF